MKDEFLSAPRQTQTVILVPACNPCGSLQHLSESPTHTYIHSREKTDGKKSKTNLQDGIKLWSNVQVELETVRPDIV